MTMNELISRIEGAGEGVADVLDGAADIIAPADAWHQGRWPFRDAKGIDCFGGDRSASWTILGAIYTEGFGTSERDIAIDALGGVEGIISFNDAPGRKQTEVVATLRLAALKARATNNGEG